MAAINELIFPQQATDFVRELFTSAHTGLPLEQFFPAKTNPSIKLRFRVSTRTVVPAVYRVYDAETPVGLRPANIAVTDVTLPPLGQKLRLSEEDQHFLLYAAAQETGNPQSDRIVDQLYDDLETATRAVIARLELARADLFIDGAMSLPLASGQTMDIDFQPPGGHTPTAGTLWSDTTNSTPLSDEKAWIYTLKTDQLGFGQPEAAVTSTRILNYLAANAEYRAAFYGASINQPRVLSQTDLNSVRGAYGLPPIQVNDEIIAGARVLPDTKFWLIPSGGLGNTQLGPTMEGLKLAGGNNPRLVGIDVPGLVGVIEDTSDPVATWTKVSAVGMPALDDKNRFFAATVAS